MARRGPSRRAAEHRVEVRLDFSENEALQQLTMLSDQTIRFGGRSVKDPNVVNGEGRRVEAPTSTDTSLLGRVRAKDPQAWERVVALYGPVVYGWCRRSGLRAPEAADVVQEVFQAVARAISTFRREQTGDTFGGWLWRITRNKLLDHGRVKRRQVDAVGGDEQLQWLAQIPGEGTVGSGSTSGVGENGRLLRRALDLIRSEVKPQSWNAFWRTAVDGRDPAEVAPELGMSRNAVYIARSRVFQRLRQELEGLIS